MSFFTKMMSGAVFAPLGYTSLKSEKSQVLNECQVDADAMQEAEALQKIFEDGGGNNMDQHEMMELMQ